MKTSSLRYLSSLPQKVQDKIGPITKEGCWPWKAAKINGYGYVRWEGSMGYAHRIVYELLKAPIPRGSQSHHSCGRRNCTNPAHIEIMSPKKHHEIHQSKNIPEIDSDAPWRETHRKYNRESKRRRYANNPEFREQQLEYQCKYREKNREKLREYGRTYYLRKKEATCLNSS